MTFALTAIGTAIIVVTARDVIHELFHPETSGSMSRFIMHLVWRIVRLIGRHYRTAVYHAGPAMLVAVGAVWMVLLAVGCGLIYLPRLPAAFDINPNLPVIAERRFYARYVDLIRKAQPSAAVAVREPPHEAVADMLRSLTEQTIRVTTQLARDHFIDVPARA